MTPRAPLVSVAELRETAARARYQARRLSYDPAAPRLLALADELDARADAIVNGSDEYGHWERVVSR